MKQVYLSLLAACLYLLPGGFLGANNIQVSNTTLNGQSTADGYTQVQFDLSWENSWRDTRNWDAAWVFVKYSVNNGGSWKHAFLNNTGHTAPSGSTISTGLLDPSSSYEAGSNPGIGVFVYRSEEGSGDFILSGIKLRWNYSENGVNDDAEVLVRVFAVEMCYVPGGSFYLGSGGNEPGTFYQYPTTSDVYQVNTAGPLSVGSTSGDLYYSSSYGTPADIPSTYPDGYGGFYCMKYEMSQGQYADFLSTLSMTQAGNRYYTVTGSYRYAITGIQGEYSSGNEHVACNYLSWMDACAYADWSGLRPMTELEYEKACRGTTDQVAGEYAWGTAYVTGTAYTLENEGDSIEGISTGYNTSGKEGNCVDKDTYTAGPLRVGIFAANASNADRVTSGSSYYGIMELSGNVVEQVVTVGNSTGLSFTGSHGDGTLLSTGYATNSDWPGYSSGNGVTGATGSGYRGGSLNSSSTNARVSDRTLAVTPGDARYYYSGFRAVRTAP